MLWRNGNSNAPPSLLRRVISLPALASLGLAAAFLVFLITRFDVDLKATWNEIEGANFWYLVLAVLVHYTTFVFRGIRWRLLLQNVQEEDSSVPGVAYCSQLVFLGWFANSIGWLRLGDAYRAYLYRDEQGASFSRTIGTILAERTLDTALVVLLLLISVPFLVGSGGGVAWAILGVAVALAFVLVLVVGGMTWARNPAMRFLPAWLSERFLRFQAGTLGSFRRLPLVTFWGLCGWMAEIGRLYLVMSALGFDLSFPLVIFVTLANSLLTLVPTPGGIGAVESGVGGVLVRLSTLSASAAVALVLVDRFISYVSIINVGAALFVFRQILRRGNTGSQSSPVAE